MYSPKLREDQVPKLYHMSKRMNKRMTKLLREIFDDWMDKAEEEWKQMQEGVSDEKATKKQTD